MAGRFPAEEAQVLLAAVHRRCCICHRFCGPKMELDHIVPGEEGGPDTIDNAIPVCFDCHAEIHSYNDKHPRGRKFRPEELRQHKEQWLQICHERPEAMLAPSQDAVALHADQQLALGILKALVVFGDAVDLVRCPMIWAHEMVGREPVPGETVAQAHDRDGLFAYSKRLQEMGPALKALDDARQEARARWGEAAQKVFAPLVTDINRLTMVAWPAYQEARWDRCAGERSSVFNEPYAILFRVPGHDEYGEGLRSHLAVADQAFRGLMESMTAG